MKDEIRLLFPVHEQGSVIDETLKPHLDRGYIVAGFQLATDDTEIEYILRYVPKGKG